MTTFVPSSANPTAASLDPTKHVKYTLGMVLGVDDFTQEFAYLSGRDQELARTLGGYGTVSGLRVTIEGPQVVVSPGVAISPRGQIIRVTPAQCADINKWLAAHAQDIIAHTSSPPSAVSLYVVLCYRPCPTDMLPLPGDPCRTEQDTMAPSRLQDDFDLELRLSPPAQHEEDGLRAFVHWLSRHLEITDAPGLFASLDDLKRMIENAAHALTSPPSPLPDFMFQSPPFALRIHTADACEFLRVAFRLWVTELLPRWRAVSFGKPPCCSGAPLDRGMHDVEECLLLAELHLPLGADGQVHDPMAVTVDERRRPYLLHLRMLQEWMLCGHPGNAYVGGPSRVFATLFLKRPKTVRAWIHHPSSLQIPIGAVTVELGQATASPPASSPRLVSVTQPVPGINLFDLELDAPVPDQTRVTVRFDAAAITEASFPFRNLIALIDGPDFSYLDRDGRQLLAYLVVDSVALDDLSDVDAPSPRDGQVLTMRGGKWVAAPSTGGGGVTAHGALTGLATDDHHQYLPVDPGTRALAANLNGGGNRIVNLSPGTGAGEAVVFQQAVKVNDPAGNDLGGTYPSPEVARIRGRTVSSVAPTATNQVLTWNQGTSVWEPKLHLLSNLGDVDTPNPQNGEVLTRQGGRWLAQALVATRPLPLMLPFVDIVQVPAPAVRTYDLWFNIDAPGNGAEIVGLNSETIQVSMETATGPSFLTRLPISTGSPSSLARNRFQVVLDKESELLRFIFIIAKIQVRITSAAAPVPIPQYMADKQISFVGHDGAETITAYVRGPRKAQ